MKTSRPSKRVGHGRKRRALGSTLVALGLLAAAVWVASRWWMLEGEYGRRSITVQCGIVVYKCNDLGAVPVHVKWEPHNEPRWRLWYGWQERYSNVQDMGLVSVLDGTWVPPGQRHLSTRIAFWPIPLLLWLSAAILFRSGCFARRRAMTGKCQACGYDLAGLAPDAPCPECGKGSKDSLLLTRSQLMAAARAGQERSA